MGAPTLTTYLLDTPEGLLIRERPIVLICPGGGYNHVSVREGEPLALQFMAMGFHAAVLNYSVSPAVYPTQLLELAKAVALLRDRAQEWHIRKDGLFYSGILCGGTSGRILWLLLEKRTVCKGKERRGACAVRLYPEDGCRYKTCRTG